MLPPDKLLYSNDPNDQKYRHTPFSIEAAKSGDFKILAKVLQHGGSLSESGAICLSKRRKNVVISNHLGAAAYYGKTSMVDQLLKKGA